MFLTAVTQQALVSRSIPDFGPQLPSAAIQCIMNRHVQLITLSNCRHGADVYKKYQ